MVGALKRAAVQAAMSQQQASLRARPPQQASVSVVGSFDLYPCKLKHLAYVSTLVIVGRLSIAGHQFC
jgi:hypothetical protein